MLLIRIFLLISLLVLTVPSLSFAEESVDDKWMVNVVNENSIHTTVNGQITHGDELHVRFVRGHCDKGNLLTSVYTHLNHPKIEQLKGHDVTTKFNGDEVIVKVAYASPFLMGHRVIIDMGWASVDKLKEILSKENQLDIEYVDSHEIKITDYFDLTQNSWSNDGVRDALNRAIVMCRTL